MLGRLMAHSTSTAVNAGLAHASASPKSWVSPRAVAVGFAVACTASTALSAFLVFQVQPMIGKAILPWFGGGPGVWTTCLLFFQLMLLGGYAYAHGLNRVVPPQLQAATHSMLVLCALFLLPIIPGATWEPLDGHSPTWRILVILFAHVGLPYLLLSASAPLLQAWYGAVHRDRTPYRLYALSNVGSLLALLSYPFVIEPMFNVTTQGLVWSFGFGIYAVGCICLALVLWSKHKRGDLAECVVAEDASATATDVLPWKTWCGWMSLAALGTAALMAFTSQMCQEISVNPLLWVVPLAVYLMSFIICFDRPSWFAPRWWSLTAIGGIFALAAYGHDTAYVLNDVLEFVGLDLVWSDYVDSIKTEAALYSVGLFLICMLAHGRLVQLRPQTRHLTSFYLAIATGGAAGGVVVALICPKVFSSYFETELVLVAGLLLAIRMLVVDGFRRWQVPRALAYSTVALVGVAGVFLIMAGAWFGGDDSTLVQMRNFYGVVRVDLVSEDGEVKSGRGLYHGRTQHGYQYFDVELRRKATTYYDRPSGVGVALRAMGTRGPIKVGVVGLGAGTVATYGRKGDTYHFYEINENVVKLAEKSFTYLRDSPATTKISLGDARVSLKRQPPQNFDVLVLDAFSGDAIPLHLLTIEAFEIYLKQLDDGGVIAVHISNRYLDLQPVVTGIAERYQLTMIPIDYDSEDDDGEVYDSNADAGSSWVLLTRDKKFAEDPIVVKGAKETDVEIGPPIIWTDQYSNLLHVMD